LQMLQGDTPVEVVVDAFVTKRLSGNTIHIEPETLLYLF